MAQALRFNYYPGMPRPKGSPRATLLWERGKREFEEAAAQRKLDLENYAKRAPQTPEEFKAAEAESAARARQRERTEAEEARQDRQQEERQRELARENAQRKDEYFIRYWNATTASDRTAGLIQYARIIGTADGYSGNFATQAAIDRTLASLKDIANCPASFKARYREIRGISGPPAPAPASTPTTEQRLATARKALLGV